MMRLTSVVCLIGIVAATTLAGCGGGGSAGPVPSAFTLRDPVFEQPGGSLTFHLTGSANTGERFTATFSYARRPDTTVNGQSVQQFDGLLTLKNTTHPATMAVTSTDYTDVYGNLVLSVDGDGVRTTPNGQQTPLPLTAAIGDFGNIGDAIATDGEASSESWRLDAYPGSLVRADLSYFGSYTNPRDPSTDGNTQEIHVIDENGNTLGLSIAIFYADGTTIDLST